MNTHHERGIALVLALFLMTALSVLGASLMFLSQTETYASMNYRMMSQARYAGEAGIQKAANYLFDSGQYPIPGDAAALANFDRTVSPVTLVSNGEPVVLSATAAVASNYPVAAVQTAFNATAQGTLAAGNATITYSAYATLLSMQVFESYGGTPNVVQTWELTGTGGLTGARNATVEVVALIETPKVAANTYGAFATNSGCGALTFGGNITINSYDSSALSGSTTPTMQADGGDVGTNGNLSISGSVDVQGNLYSPRTGVGTCDEGAVTALTESGSAQVSGSVVQLPTVVTYPPPVVPSPSPLADVGLSSGGDQATTCGALGLTPGAIADVSAGTAQCNVTGDTITINGNGSTLSLPTLSLSAGVDLVMVASGPVAAQYNFNSISLAGGSTIGASATSPTESVLVNVVGKNPDSSDIAVPIDFTGGTYAAVTGCGTCSDYDASILQFVYGGSGEIRMTGNSGAAATFYAPDASVTFSGTSDLYGSVLANRINTTGSGNIHYDQRLSHDFWVAGHPMVGTFTWKRY
jgi:hypothetical protein